MLKKIVEVNVETVLFKMLIFFCIKICYTFFLMFVSVLYRKVFNTKIMDV